MKKSRRSGMGVGNEFSMLSLVFLVGVLVGVGVMPVFNKVREVAGGDTINASDVDSVAPQVSITNPTSRMKISPNMNLNIGATATDNVGVTYVDFRVSLLTRAPSTSGGTLQIPGRKEYITLIHQCTSSSAPYECLWKVPSDRNATYLIQAVGYDLAGNQGISKYIEFTVR